MPRTQWVNLPKKQVFVDADVGIQSLAELGEAEVEVELEKAEETAFSYRLTATPADLYTEDEMNKNPAFRGRLLEGKEVSDGSGTTCLVQKRIALSQGGGIEYGLEAVMRKAIGAQEEVVSADEGLITARALFFQSITMADIDPDDVEGVLDQVVAYFGGDDLRLDLFEIDNFKTLTESDVVPEDELEKVVGDCAKLLEYKKYLGYLFGVAWVNGIARLAQQRVLQTATAVADIPGWSSDKAQISVTLDEPLWVGFDPAQDLEKGWFVGGTYKAKVKGGADVTGPVKPEHAKLDDDGDPLSSVVLVLEDLLFRDVLEIEYDLTFNIAEQSSGYASGATIVIATKSHGEDVPEDELVHTLIHEIGHLIGMVPDGKTPRAPFTHTGYYGDFPAAGHRGPHCKGGMTWSDAEKDWSSATPTCVMFGEVLPDRFSKVFCADCAKIVRKLDLRMRS